jgi:predicted DNA-binding transcriptional regulator AlpA
MPKPPEPGSPADAIERALATLHALLGPGVTAEQAEATIASLEALKPSKARTVEVRNIISVHEILKLAGKPRQSVPRSTLQRWRDRHEFPRPLKTVGRRTELWDVVEVRAWLEAWRARGSEREEHQH